MFEKGNKQLEEQSKTHPEFVNKADLLTENSRFDIRTWENALKMYKFYGK